MSSSSLDHKGINKPKEHWTRRIKNEVLALQSQVSTLTTENALLKERLASVHPVDHASEQLPQVGASSGGDDPDRSSDGSDDEDGSDEDRDDGDGDGGDEGEVSADGDFISVFVQKLFDDRSGAEFLLKKKWKVKMLKVLVCSKWFIDAASQKLTNQKGEVLFNNLSIEESSGGTAVELGHRCQRWRTSAKVLEER